MGFHAKEEAADVEVYLGFLVFGALTGAAAYLLYCRGIAVTKNVAALSFVFRTGKDGDWAALNSCTGWVRHVGRFRRSGTYAFSLDCRLSKGDASVLLLDQEKREFLHLNRYRASGSICLHRECRYSLRWEFQNATGKCVLCWENDPAKEGIT